MHGSSEFTSLLAKPLPLVQGVKGLSCLVLLKVCIEFILYGWMDALTGRYEFKTILDSFYAGCWGILL